MGVVFLYLTITRIPHYRNALSFWEKATLDSPSSAFVHMYLSKIYFMQNNLLEAKKEALTALGSRHTEHLQYPHHYLGIIHARLGENEEAELQFKKQILLNPDYAEVHSDLKKLYLNK